MSGDVFGNGMLLSQHIQLIAAFNHLHIFIDPNPDPRRQLRRARAAVRAAALHLGGLRPGADLRRAAASTPRSAKSIALSPEVAGALGINAEELTPNELINAILRAPVDLLWNGGIGTYVKASDETHAEVGDRANDGLRVDASELRCRVVGEGGNLGLTQLGRDRVRPGRRTASTPTPSTTPAGVDCSDHEVNIKILLDRSSPAAT